MIRFIVLTPGQHSKEGQNRGRGGESDVCGCPKNSGHHGPLEYVVVSTAAGSFALCILLLSNKERSGLLLSFGLTITFV